MAPPRGGGCDSGSEGRTPWRGAPRPGRSGPCRRCPAACRRCVARASRSATSLPTSRWRLSGCALDDPARHGQDQRHGHVGGVLGQHARRVGNDDATMRAVSRSILSTPVPKLAMSLSCGSGLRSIGTVDAVGDGGHEHVRDLTASASSACVIGLSSTLSCGSNSSHIRVSTTSGSLRVTITRGFLREGRHGLREGLSQQWRLAQDGPRETFMGPCLTDGPCNDKTQFMFGRGTSEPST